MADYSGAYEKIDYVPKSKQDKVKELAEKLGEAKVAKHAELDELVTIKGTLATGGVVSSHTNIAPWGYGPQTTERVSKRTIRSSKSYDAQGNLTFEEEEEIIEYAPAINPFTVTNVTSSTEVE